MEPNEQPKDLHRLMDATSHVVNVGSSQHNSLSSYHALTLLRVSEGRNWTEYMNYSPNTNICHLEQIHGVIVDETFTIELLADILEKFKNLRHFRVTDKARLVCLDDDDTDACGGRTYTQFSVLQIFMNWKKQKHSIVPKDRLVRKFRLDHLRDFALVFKDPLKKELALDSSLFILRTIGSTTLSNFSIHFWLPVKSTPDSFVSILNTLVEFLLDHKNTLKSISIKFSEEEQGMVQRFWNSIINSKFIKSSQSQEAIRDKISSMMGELTLKKFVFDVIQMTGFNPATTGNSKNKSHWIHFLEHLHSLEHLSLFLNTEHYRMFNFQRMFCSIKATLTVIRIWIYLEDPFDFIVLQNCHHLNELFFYNNLPRYSHEIPQMTTAINLRRIPLQMKSIALMNLAYETDDALELLKKQKDLDTLVLMNLPLLKQNIGVDQECLEKIIAMRELECCLITSVHPNACTFCCTIVETLNICNQNSRDPTVFSTCCPPKLNFISTGEIHNRRYTWAKSLQHSDFYNYDCFYVNVNT